MRQHLRRGGTVVTLSNLKTVVDKTGKARRYLRVKGHKLVPLPDLPPDHPDFLAAWSEAMKRIKGRPARPGPGSIAAWTGHESLSEVAHYTRSADRKRAVMGTNESRTVANAADPVGKLARK